MSAYSTVAQGAITAARQWCFLPIRQIKSWGNTSSGSNMRCVLTNTSGTPLATPFMARVVPTETWGERRPGIGPGGLAPDSPFLGLATAAPNPTRDRTIVQCSLAKSGPVEIAVYDIAGRCLQTLFAGSRDVGPGSVVVDCSALPRGVYLVRIRTGGMVAAKRLVMINCSGVPAAALDVGGPDAP